MEPDPWLERWTTRIGAQATAPNVLELGCGEGRDTRLLLQAGFRRITALDLSGPAVAQCQTLSDDIRCIQHDLRGPLPLADSSVDVALASLCLHYFSWPDTEAMVLDIRRVLVPGGLLLCRLNSTRDVHYGAAGHPELEPHLYQVNGHPKRFFDRADVDALFDPAWRRIAVQEQQVNRYKQPKTVWEVVLTT